MSDLESQISRFLARIRLLSLLSWIDGKRIAVDNEINLNFKGKAVLVLFNFLALLLLGAQMLRDPWVDELSTYFFIESPEEFVTRVGGDPHPVGYYSLALLSNVLVEMFAPGLTFWEIWPVLKLSTLLFSGVIFLLLMSIFIWTEIRARKKKLWTYGAVLPSLTIFAATFGVATDFRSYGVQSLGALLVVISMYVNFPRKTLSRTQTAALVVALALLASLDVWASILSVWLFLLAIALWDTRKELLFLGGFVWLPVVFISYALGPLSSVNVSDEGFGIPRDWILGLGAGFSFHFYLAIPLFALWLFTALGRKDSMLIFFELPAVLTILSAFIFSIAFIPIFKWYVLAPIYALLSASTLLRLASYSGMPILPAALLAVSAFHTSFNPLNVVSDDAIWTSRGALESKQNWRETSQFIIREVALSDSTEIFSNRTRFNEYLLPELESKSLEEIKNRDCTYSSQNEGALVMLNHVSINEQKSIAAENDLVVIRSWPTGGVFSHKC